MEWEICVNRRGPGRDGTETARGGEREARWGRCVRDANGALGYIARRREIRRGLDVELTLEKVAVELEHDLGQGFVLAEGEASGGDRIPRFPREFGVRGVGGGGVVDLDVGEFRRRAPVVEGDEGVEGVSAVAAVVEENGHVSLLETDVTVELGEAFGD